MATVYNTPRGESFDPMPVELWRWNGTGPLGRLETSEKIEVTWAERGTGTAVIDTPLTDLSALLLDEKGETLVVVDFNGKRHISSVVEAELYDDPDAVNDVRVKATTASAWSMLEGAIIRPVPPASWGNQGAAEELVVTGPVETVVKKIIGYAVAELGLPINIMPDQGRGRTVTVRGECDTAADMITDALDNAGMLLELEPWLPGDDNPGDFSLTTPALIAEVRPYRDNPGLALSAEGRDLDSFSLKHTRPTATKVILAQDTDSEDIPKKYARYAFPSKEYTPWAAREVYASVGKDADLGAESGKLLREHAEARSLEATAVPALSWEFGVDGEYARQYDVGDRCEVVLPRVGSVTEVISEVTVELTPESLTVTPKVGSSDTTERDLYALVAALSKRLDRVQKRGR